MKKYYLCCLFLSVAFLSQSQPTVTFSSIITGLTAPIDIVNAADASNRLFIVQQNGIVRIYSGGALLPGNFLNMSTLITYGGERGLLSIAFHPNYETNRYFFVFYNNLAGDTELAQYQTLSSDPNVADPASRRIILTITKPFANHNGCKLNFGPDGHLYFAPGDGGSGGDPGNRAQSLNTLLGKMLRINVDNFTTPPYYTVPASNPYVGVGGALPEIYATGLRNPWRWNFDRLTGDMWIADVGQGAREEVNMVPAASTSGRNYGWRCYEGSLDYDLSLCGASPTTGKTFPIFEYAHNAAGGFSISGGLVYRGSEYPALQGWYFCADYVNPNGWLIQPNGSGGWNVATQNNFPANVSTFGDAEDGTLYLASLGGTIYKIVGPTVVPVRLVSFNAIASAGKDLLTWRITPDVSLSIFEIEQSVNGTAFSNAGTVTPTGNSTDYSFTVTSPNGDRYYRLKMIYNNGSVQYSSVLKLSSNQSGKITVSNKSSGEIQIITPAALEKLYLINIMGQRVREYGNLSAGVHLLNTDRSAPGLYILQCIKRDRSVETLKVFIN